MACDRIKKKELGFGQWLANWVPGAIDSSWVRFAGELYFYRTRYTHDTFNEWWDVAHNANVIGGNVQRFGEVVDGVIERFDNPKRTSMQLLSEQVYKIDQFDMLDELKTINEQRGEKQMPVILYLGTGKPGHDYMVNDSLSSDNFKQYAKETDLQYFHYLVPGAIHSFYYKTIDEYMSVFEKASKPVERSIQAEASRHVLNLLALEQQEVQDEEVVQAEE